ncbi:LINE-1 type transposase domain-containing protein 1 isoform 2-T2 [Sarcophilus harrisii]
MSKKLKRILTIFSFYTDREQTLNPEETKNRLSPGESPKEEIICSSAQMNLIEEIKKALTKELEEKWEKEREAWQESLEKSSPSFKDRVDKEIKSLKNRISELETENSSLKNKIGEMEKHSIEQIGLLEKDIKKVSEENTSLKIRIEQMELNDSRRQEESVKQNQKNQTMEKNVKYLLGKTTDLENRSRRDNLRIIGFPEKYDEKKSLDTIFQEIIKENCPEVIEREGKIDIERIHRSPTERDPKIKTPRNIVAKCQSPQTKEKILQAARNTQFKYRGATVRITQNLAASTLKDQRAWNMIFQKAKELDMQPKITYPARMSIFFQERSWSFNKISEFHLFLVKKPELNKKFDLQI